MKAKDKLFLLKPGFFDGSEGPYFCPECAQVTGLLEFYPELKEHLEIHWIDFKRPRPALVDLLGEGQQGCPVLVLNFEPEESLRHLARTVKGHWFVEGANEIAEYFAKACKTGIPH